MHQTRRGSISPNSEPKHDVKVVNRMPVNISIIHYPLGKFALFN